MTVLFAAATIGFLYYVCSHAPQSKAYDNREDKTSNPHTMIYYIGILLLGVSTFLTADRFLITCNYIGIYLLSMTVFLPAFAMRTNGVSGNTSVPCSVQCSRRLGICSAGSVTATCM